MIRTDYTLYHISCSHFPMSYCNLSCRTIDLQNPPKYSFLKAAKELLNSSPSTPINAVVFYVYCQAPYAALAGK
jgi:hypothetical protein